MTRRGRHLIIWIFILILFAASCLPEGEHWINDKEVHQDTKQLTAGEVFEGSIYSGDHQGPANNAPLMTEAVLPLPVLVPGETASVTPVMSRPSHLEPHSSQPNTNYRSVDVDAVTIGALRLRFGPDNSHPQTGVLPGDVPVHVIGRYQGWLLVTSGHQLSGWVPQNGLVLSPAFDISQVSQLTPPELSHTNALLVVDTTIYAGPGTYYAVAAKNVPADTHVHVAGHTPDRKWALITDEQGAAGWLPVSALTLQPGFDLENTAVIEQPPPVTVTTFEWGGQTHDLLYADLMRELGMSWAKIQYKWRPESQPTDVQDLIVRSHQAGLKVLLAIPGQPYPETINYEAYVRFLQGVAALDPAPDALEVWNEMNIDFEWPAGAIDPAAYVTHMLAPAYQAIKQANPHILVISGAPAPTGFDNGRHAWSDQRYVAGMVEAGAGAYLDCVGVHYNAGATSPEAVSGHPGGEYFGWYYRPSLAMYYQAFGGQRPLCITEIGYLAQGGYRGHVLPPRFWWASQTTLDQQGKWLSEAILLAQESRMVQLLIVFNVNIHHWDENDPQGGYALVRANGSCPACAWLSNLTPGQGASFVNGQRP